MASTAAPSAPSLSPRPIQRAAARAAASVTRTSSMARLRSGACWVEPLVMGGNVPDCRRTAGHAGERHGRGAGGSGCWLSCSWSVTILRLAMSRAAELGSFISWQRPWNHPLAPAAETRQRTVAPISAPHPPVALPAACHRGRRSAYWPALLYDRPPPGWTRP